MAGDKEAKAALAISVPAIIAAALALTKKQVAAGGQCMLPAEFVQLVAAIAASDADIDTEVGEILNKLSNLGINVQGWPPNVKTIRSLVVVCAIAGRPYQASQMAIPSGMNLVIKASPLNAAMSLIYVASTAADCTNPNSSYPLVPNEPIAYAVQDASEIFISSNIAGSAAIFTAEQGG